jgi:hypothetical protein
MKGDSLKSIFALVAAMLRVTFSAAPRGARLVDQQIEPPASAKSEPTRLSAAAERMRRHRNRKRQGLRCVRVWLRETEVDVLIGQGLLPADARNDTYAIREAIHKHFDRSLTPTP